MIVTENHRRRVETNGPSQQKRQIQESSVQPTIGNLFLPEDPPLAIQEKSKDELPFFRCKVFGPRSDTAAPRLVPACFGTFASQPSRQLQSRDEVRHLGFTQSLHREELLRSRPSETCEITELLKKHTAKFQNVHPPGTRMQKNSEKLAE